MKYNTKHIMKKVQKRAQSGVTMRHVQAKHDMEMELKDMQLKLHQAKLKKFEDVEKRRLDGLKKAQAAKKKKKSTNAK